MRQLRGISAKWLLPLDKSLATCLPRNATLDLDIKHGMHVAKHYHKGGRTQVQGTVGRQQGMGTGALGEEAWVVVETVVEGAEGVQGSCSCRGARAGAHECGPINAGQGKAGHQGLGHPRIRNQGNSERRTRRTPVSAIKKC